ncbi:Reverse transcriptase (RNA-dependent DNA polymerase), putative [Angomonas deanei]|uniref:Reverse transcriptase (RNA-dependent DNA polymerase), putative n=1 Tax=Angomonas deanei TaxID=59799 RepID=A0A7G2CRN4_9TRYP|nr:Reverse transcriptase (RNA-dependent DNA polymerase), putative [Angomonas deanei]
MQGMKMDMYTRLLSALRDPPDVLCLQEVHAWTPAYAEAFHAVGYSVAASRFHPADPVTGRFSGGVVTLIHRERLHAVEVIPSTPHPAPPFDDVMVLVTDDGASLQSVYGIANCYWPPECLDNSDPIHEMMAYYEHHQMDIVVGDLNARHWRWCPSCEVKLSSEAHETLRDNAFPRGKWLEASISGSSWRIANDRRVFTRPITLGARAVAAADRVDQGTSPDVAICSRHLTTKFAVLNSENGEACLGPTRRGVSHPVWSIVDLYALSDHWPVVLSVDSCLRPFTPVPKRCPAYLFTQVEDWVPLRAKWTEMDPQVRLRGDSLSAVFGRWEGLKASTLRLVPQRPRASSFHPALRLAAPELKLSYQCALAAIKERDAGALAHIRCFRENYKEILEEERNAYYCHLVYGRRSVDWTREVWKNFSPPTDLPPGLACPRTGVPLSLRAQANALAVFFREKHQRSTSADTQKYLCECLAAIAQLSVPTVMQHLPVTPAEVAGAVQRLRRSQAPDPSGLIPVFLAELPPEGLELLRQVFDVSLQRSQLPQKWRYAQVIPIYKGAPKPRTDFSSYRPVAVTALECRVMEHIIRDRLLHALHHAKQPLHPLQFGFRPGLSAETAIAHIVSSLVEQGRLRFSGPTGPLDSGIFHKARHCTLCVAVDFTDAFCRVMPEVVELVLRQRGAPQELIQWVAAFLKGRRMQVFIAGRFSKSHGYEVGCPQGSVLGPLLWALAMEGLLTQLDTLRKLLDQHQLPGYLQLEALRNQSGLSSFFKGQNLLRERLLQHSAALRFADGKQEHLVDPLIPRNSYAAPMLGFAAYADDLTFWVSGVTPASTLAAAQETLSVISRWGAQMGIEVSPKTRGMWLAPPHCAAKYPTRPVRLQLTVGRSITIAPLPVTGATTHPLSILGVLVDSRLTFSDHAEQVVALCSERLAQLETASPSMGPGIARMIILSLVGSRLRYCLGGFWATARQRVRHLLEQAWAHMAKIITGTIFNPRREVMLAEAGLRPLDYYAKAQILRLSIVLSVASATGRRCAVPQKNLLLFPPNTPKDQSMYMGHHLVLLQEELVKASNCWRDSHFEWLQAQQDAVLTSRALFDETPLSRVISALSRVRFWMDLQYEDGRRMVKSRTTPVQLAAFNARQLQRSSPDVGVTLWTDGSVIGSEKSGGAYLLYHSTEGPVLHGSLSLGPACSYSVERAALFGGLTATAEWLATQPEEVQRLPLRIATDSLAVLEALRAGPFHQRDAEGAQIWATFAALPSAEIRLVFVFSHVGGEGQNPTVDSLARAACSEQATIPRWLGDVGRFCLNGLKEEYDVVTDSIRGSVGITGPSRDISSLRLRPREHRDLLRLRVGACPLAGGFSHVVDTCIRCGAPIGRESMAKADRRIQSAVRHMFECPVFLATKEGQERQVTVVDLWKKPVLAVLWAVRFCHHRLVRRLDGVPYT